MPRVPEARARARWLRRALLALGAALFAAALFLYVSLRPLPALTPPPQGAFFSDVTVIEPGVARSERRSLRVEGERIAAIGDAQPAADDPFRGAFLLPGLNDLHVHFPQTEIIGSYGAELLEWLERYAFPCEARFADAGHARDVARFFVDELLRNGTTTALVFATVHPGSADAIFEAARARGMRLVAGKVLMDRNCPEPLREPARAGYAATAELIARWHGQGRLAYAVTPRFAPTSSDAQLRMAGRLLERHAGLYMQTHVAENRDEVRWVAELFPAARSYLDVYERFGLLNGRAVLAHGIWIDDVDRALLRDRGALVAHSPTSNLFLGSGLWGLAEANDYTFRDAAFLKSLPVDLYVDAGIRIDTDLGIFELTIANALGRLR